MSDDKKKQGYQDDSKINANEPYEVEYAAKEFGVTPEQIRHAIQMVGSSRENVRKYLKK